jgi:hypothetical protein
MIHSCQPFPLAYISVILNVRHIPSKFRIIAVTGTLNLMFYIKFVSVLIIYTKFHTSSPTGSFVIKVKPKAKGKFRVVAMFPLHSTDAMQAPRGREDIAPTQFFYLCTRWG